MVPALGLAWGSSRQAKGQRPGALQGLIEVVDAKEEQESVA